MSVLYETGISAGISRSSTENVAEQSSYGERRILLFTRIWPSPPCPPLLTSDAARSIFSFENRSELLTEPFSWFMRTSSPREDNRGRPADLRALHAYLHPTQRPHLIFTEPSHSCRLCLHALPALSEDGGVFQIVLLNINDLEGDSPWNNANGAEHSCVKCSMLCLPSFSQ